MVEAVLFTDDAIEDAMLQAAKRMGYTSIRPKQAEAIKSFVKGR